MQDTLHFHIERFDDDGVYYVVSGVEIALTTDGETLEEALRNLREAVELYFEGDNLPKLPKIEVNIEVTAEYA
ncbi:MAG: type II toxin-antitoxin system HicB family antitoxin [Anaerolineae bacterium]|nr:MAG: type II toxin-antitoxin system HicB family antitoxin [Anaerolineae bacterium]